MKTLGEIKMEVAQELKRIACTRMNRHTWVNTIISKGYPIERGRKCIFCGKKQITDSAMQKWYDVINEIE